MLLYSAIHLAGSILIRDLRSQVSDVTFVTRLLIVSFIALITASACTGDTVSDEGAILVTSTPMPPPAGTASSANPTARPTATLESAVSPTATPGAVEAEPLSPLPGKFVLETSMQDWEPYESEGVSIFWDSGSYHLRVNELVEGWNWNTAYAQTYVAAFGNVSVSVEVRNVSAAGYSEGCLITRSDPLGLTYFNYVLCLNTFENGIHARYEQLDCDGTWREDVLVEYGLIEAINPADEWNILKIVSRDYQHWFYVNGQLIGAAEHVGPLSGTIGMVIQAWDHAPTEWEYRNLAVYVAEGGDPSFTRPDPAPDIFNKRCEDDLS